jgi:hypothetical protein
MTFYFRHYFTVPTGITNPPLRLWHVIDDGAVFYLNGSEIYRVGITNPVLATIPAERVVPDAVQEGPFYLFVTNLFPGPNLLAVEVRQNNSTSSDVVFGAAVDALLLPAELPLPSLKFTRQGANLSLIWRDPGLVLEQASAVQGPWARVPAAASPWSLAVLDGQQFYRLRE